MGDIFMISGLVPNISATLIFIQLYLVFSIILEIECKIIPENTANVPISVSIIMNSVGPNGSPPPDRHKWRKNNPNPNPPNVINNPGTVK
jgi:hypothetical protein